MIPDKTLALIVAAYASIFSFADPASGQVAGPTTLSVEFMMGDPASPEDANLGTYAGTFGMPKAEFEAQVASDLVSILGDSLYARALPWKFVAAKERYPRLVVLMFAEKSDWRVRLNYQARSSDAGGGPGVDLTNLPAAAAVEPVFFPDAEKINPKRSDFRKEVVRLFQRRFRDPGAGTQLQIRLRRVPVGLGVTLIDPKVTKPAEAYGALRLPFDQYASFARATFEGHGRLKIEHTAYKISSKGIGQRYKEPGCSDEWIEVRHESLEHKQIGVQELQTLRDLESQVIFYLVDGGDEPDEPINLPSESALTVPTVRGVR